MLGDLALVEHDMRLRVDARGDKGRGHLADGARQLGGILPGRDGVQVDDAIDAVVALLQLDEPLDRAEIVAEVQVTSRLHARKNQMLERHGLVLGSMIPKKLAPDLIRGGSRFSEKIMLNRKMPACMPWRQARGK